MDHLIIKLVIKALLDDSNRWQKHWTCSHKGDQSLKILNPEETKKYVAEIEKENKKKKQKKASWQ